MGKVNLSQFKPFEWGTLNWIEIEIDLSIKSLRNIHSANEILIEKEKKELKAKLENDTQYQSLNGSDKESYFEWKFDDYFGLQREITKWHRYSFCVTIFTFFEGMLRTICEAIERENDFIIKMSNLRFDSDLAALKTYLVKVYGLDFTKIEGSFTYVINQKKVRNMIAHQNGIPTSNQILPAISGISKSRFGNILIESSYLTNLLNKSDKFFKELLIALDERYKEIRKNN